MQPPLVRTFSSGEARLRRSHFRNHFASPDQLRRRWFEDRHPKSGGRGRAQLVADVTGTLMQQRRHVVVLTSSDGLESFPTSHDETQTTYSKQHSLALALGSVWKPVWDGTKAVTMNEEVTLPPRDQRRWWQPSRILARHWWRTRRLGRCTMNTKSPAPL